MTQPRSRSVRSQVRSAAAAAALAATSIAGLAFSSPAQAADCKAVSIVSVRGTGEPQSGSWLQKPIGDEIAAALPGQTKYTELEYPAAFNFDESPSAGVTALVNLLNSEVSACPNQRYVVMGYSQGAYVIGDALVTPDKRVNGKDAGVISSTAASKVAAIMLYGDPGFVAGEPFNAGTPEPGVSGDKPRAKGALDAYADRISDFCARRDFACQKGGNSAAHLAYFVNGMGSEGATFAVQKIKG